MLDADAGAAGGGLIMDNLLGSRISGGNSAYKRVESDFYPTPPEVTSALLDFLKLPAGITIWEPACGQNHMVNVFRDAGYKVIATDIQNGTDFLTAACAECDWIITNPPFSIADQFIRQCIHNEKPFALLLKSQYWHAKKRLSLFRSYPPSYILPLTWRPDFMFRQRGGGAPLMDVMWVVWNGNCDTKYIPLDKPNQRRNNHGCREIF